MSKRRIEIMSHLESAAVDGAFKLHVDRNGQLIATDLLEKTKPFAIRFDGAENPLDRFVDLYVNSEDLIAQDERPRRADGTFMRNPNAAGRNNQKIN